MEPVNFYIEALDHASSVTQTWLIFRASLTHCVGIHDTPEAAIAAAIPMAQYCVAAGGAARIYIRDFAGAPWREVTPPV